MKYADIQSHFHDNPVKYLGKGSQAKVYGTDRLVVKKLWEEGTMAEKFHMEYQMGKDRLGGLAVPFQAVDDICVSVRDTILSRVLPCCFAEDVTISKPIVQERVEKSDFFFWKLNDAIGAQWQGEVNDLIESFFTTLMKIWRRGLVIDPGLKNFVVSPNMSMRTFDMGYITDDLIRGMLRMMAVRPLILEGLAARGIGVERYKGGLFSDAWLAENFGIDRGRSEPVPDVSL